MRFSAKEKTHWKTTLFRPHMHFLGAAGKGREDSSCLNILELVDISPSQQLLHTGKVSIEHWNMAPMDWVGILGQKYWINLQTKYLKYFNTDIFVRFNALVMQWYIDRKPAGGLYIVPFGQCRNISGFLHFKDFGRSSKLKYHQDIHHHKHKDQPH